MLSRSRVALNAHLLSDENSYRSAGIHAYIYNTLIRLPLIGTDFDYTVLLGKARLPDGLDWKISRSRWPTSRPESRILWEQFAAPMQLVSLRPALFHGMAFSLPFLWPGKSVVTIFDMSFVRYPNRLTGGRRRYLEVMARVSARKAQRVIAISESGRAEIASLLGIESSRIDVALPGVSDDFRPSSAAKVDAFRRRNGLPDRFILYVGTLEPRKNLETLVRAYAQLYDRAHVKLVLVGARGWQTDPLFKLVENLELSKDILLAGYVEASQLPLWYSAAEVFVYPSLYEGFGLPVIEAMACGTPVVVSNTTSLPEAVGPDGLLVDPTDVTAWAEAVGAVLKSRDLREDLSKRGQKRAQSFAWDRTAQRTVAAYRSALGMSGNKSNGAA